jgi:Skp family chaperone for outer membrane proteins
MKKNILIYFIFLFACTITISAQKKMNRKNFEKIKTLKVNYISSELNFSPEVAEKFWPIYNQYERVNRQLRSTNIRNIKIEIDQNGSIDSLSDEKALELSKRFLRITEKYVQNKRSTFNRLQEILTPQQLLKLNFVEIDFNKKVLRKLHKEDH